MSVQTTERAAGFEHADVARAFAQALGKGQSALTADEAAFINHVLEDFRPEELPQASASDLAGVLAGFWRFGEQRGGDAPVVRLTRAKGKRGELKADLLEVVQPD